jgi:CheY-like chemotaxis protein
MPSIDGQRVLIVEDEYLVAVELSRHLRCMGAVVLGPAPSIEAAERELAFADAAILDIDLRGQKVFPVADRLAARGVPFVFFTGHSEEVPYRFRHASCLMKPASLDSVFEALFPTKSIGCGPDSTDNGDEDIVALLPKLRLSARLMLGDTQAADRLVELCLKRAIKSLDSRSRHNTLEEWLTTTLEETWRSGGRRLLH